MAKLPKETAGSMSTLHRLIREQGRGECPGPRCHKCWEEVQWELFPDDTWLREFRITGLCRDCMDELEIKPQQ